MENSRIAKYNAELQKANGNKKLMLQTIERIQSSCASAVLGRDFLESTTSFLNRKPEIAAFIQWTQTIELTQDYKIVNAN